MTGVCQSLEKFEEKVSRCHFKARLLKEEHNAGQYALTPRTRLGGCQQMPLKIHRYNGCVDECSPGALSNP